jgi:hypothetical protein
LILEVVRFRRQLILLAVPPMLCCHSLIQIFPLIERVRDFISKLSTTRAFGHE